jgi:uncharacterized glyoxalase superfamily protein PhnB
MARPKDLVVGQPYFAVTYVPPERTPIVTTYRFLGADPPGVPGHASGPQYYFRCLPPFADVDEKEMPEARAWAEIFPGAFEGWGEKWPTAFGADKLEPLLSLGDLAAELAAPGRTSTPPRSVVPMIHVPDVRVTVAWYQSIGFTEAGTHEEDGEMSWARLVFGGTEIMLNAGGSPSARHRREVDLFVQIEDVDEMYRQLKDRVDVVEEPHDTFYGMRELIIRDLNRFWITFGQPARPAR